MPCRNTVEALRPRALAAIDIQIGHHILQHTQRLGGAKNIVVPVAAHLNGRVVGHHFMIDHRVVEAELPRRRTRGRDHVHLRDDIPLGPHTRVRILILSLAQAADAHRPLPSIGSDRMNVLDNVGTQGGIVAQDHRLR